MMPLGGEFVDGGDLGEALYRTPSHSTPVCGFGPFLLSSPPAAGCCFPHIASAPVVGRHREKKKIKKTYVPDK